MDQEYECPECGRLLDVCEDEEGITFQCVGHDCMQLYDAREILGDDDDD